MRIFLTGGSGFIGRRFIKLALSNGHYIYAVSRNRKFVNKKNLIWLIGEVDKDWKKYMKKSDVLVHLAAISDQESQKKNSIKILSFNLEKSFKMILKAIDCKCKNFVIASTSSEYLNNGKCKSKGLSVKSTRGFSSMYSLSKIVFSDLIKYLSKKINVNFTIMRIFPTYGVGENKNRLYPTLKKFAKQGKNLKIYNPFEVRDFTNVDYVAKVLVDVCENKPKKRFSIFHISSNDTKSIKDFSTYFWKKFNAKGSLKFKPTSKKYYRHVSELKSNWNLRNEK